MNTGDDSCDCADARGYPIQISVYRASDFGFGFGFRFAIEVHLNSCTTIVQLIMHLWCFLGTFHAKCSTNQMYSCRLSINPFSSCLDCDPRLMHGRKAKPASTVCIRYIYTFALMVVRVQHNGIILGGAENYELLLH